ncbi:hypothetical protein [Gimesia maris]|mgnify:CR=1 FL=1|uniref:hypothetical protein n=1 Tax=Gimesia maris TaxID=122 RepID=UPI00241C5688|nr:hypothetical protein [Gimesia maris]|tara:strand:- start:54994 stop:55665 length:672 start_codon:yes stop_codon:yes gene_type:complete
MQLSDLSKRITELIELGESVRDTAQNISQSRNYEVDMTKFYTFRTASLSFLRNVFGISHPYYSEFDKIVFENRIPPTLKAIGILQGVQSDIAGGWLQTSKSLATAEVLADFFDMAEHLLDSGYKDPAAVVLGSVLEEHLRNLAKKNNVEIVYEKDGKQIPKKADSLNAELAKSAVYNLLDQKNITAWLDLRNKAAHGHYNEYSEKQVRVLFNALLDFLQRNTT